MLRSFWSPSSEPLSNRMHRAGIRGLRGPAAGGCVLAMALAAALAWALTLGCHRARPGADSAGRANAPEPTPVARSAPIGRGRAAVRPSLAALEAAQRSMSTDSSSGGPKETTCGPYRARSSAASEYSAVCETLASQADARYQARLGVTISHPADGLILVFGSAERFRRFASGFGGLPAGYSGFTMASRGVVAVSAEGLSRERFASILVHELAHLQHRRAFGPNLAPWLSEGLAEALASTATASGFAELSGLRGAEPLADRLHQALRQGRVSSAAAVIEKSRSAFDREEVSLDYEASSLLVRFLLLDPDASSRFRSALRRLAGPDGCDSGCLFEELQWDATELDHRFRAWLERQVAAQP